MSRVSVPKYKVDRRLGVNLWGRPKSPFNTRPTRPGQHGKTMRKRRISGFGLQWAEKQKLQFYYAMKERQLRTCFIKAKKSKNVAQELISLLERRLDAFVYRMKWAPTIFAAKQMIKHKHILVNGKVCSISSCLLDTNDIVTLKHTIKEHAIVKDSMNLAEREVPSYYEVQDEGKSGRLLKYPTLEEVPYAAPINLSLVVEFYSRKV